MANYVEIIKSGLIVGLIDADLLDGGTRHPNLALMKLSAYCKKHRCKVSLLEDYDEVDACDIVFVSCVFTFTTVPNALKKKKNVHLGGTGFFPDGGENLPEVIEHGMPDYHLYDAYIERQISLGRKRSWFADYLDYSIGFLTRGCFRKCSFCVNKKYNKATLHASLSEFLDESRPKVYLWDDNFLACSNWEEALDELEASGKPFQFRQGLDIRLLNDRSASRFSRANYCGDFIFAFDHVEDKELIEKKLALWRHYTTRGTRLYVLCAFDSQDEADIESVFLRIKTLMRYGCLPYIMRYESYKASPWRSLYVSIARWCNQPQFFKKKSFREFCEANQVYHKTPGTFCAAYRSLIEFQQEHPAIAEKYFDLKYEEENMFMRYGRPFLLAPTSEVDAEQEENWMLARSCESTDTLLAMYYAKRIDVVWLMLRRRDDCQDAVEDLFSVISSASFDELFAAIADGASDEAITPENIPQFSSLRDVGRVAEILLNLDEPLSYEKLGIYLQPDKQRNAVANKKYGENHGKTAVLLDFAYMSREGSLVALKPTPFADYFSTLTAEGQERMLAKFALRIPLIQKVIRDARRGSVAVSDYMRPLSESTKKRRLPNVVSLMRAIEGNLGPDDLNLAKALRNVAFR